MDYVSRPIQCINPYILRVNTLATSAACNILVYMIITSYYDKNYVFSSSMHILSSEFNVCNQDPRSSVR